MRVRPRLGSVFLRYCRRFRGVADLEWESEEGFAGLRGEGGDDEE